MGGGRVQREIFLNSLYSLLLLELFPKYCNNCVMRSMGHLLLDGEKQILDCDGHLLSDNDYLDNRGRVFFYDKIERYPNGNTFVRDST